MNDPSPSNLRNAPARDGREGRSVSIARRITITVFAGMAAFAVASAFRLGMLLAPPPRTAHIVVDPPTVDFGQVHARQTPSMDARFRIMNKGDSPLIIRAVRSDCSCIEPRLNQSVVPPGKTAILAATYAFPDRVGTYESRIAIYSNDLATPVEVATVRAFVVLPIVVAPDPFVIHPTQGQLCEAEVVIRSPSDPDLRILKVESPTRQLRVVDIRDDGLDVGNVRRWSIRLAVQWSGVGRQTLQLRATTSNSEEPVVKFAAVIDEYCAVVISPAMIVMRQSAVPASDGTSVTVRRDDDKALGAIAELKHAKWLEVEPMQSGLNQRDARFRVSLTGGDVCGGETGITIRFTNWPQPIVIPVYVVR